MRRDKRITAGTVGRACTVSLFAAAAVLLPGVVPAAIATTSASTSAPSGMAMPTGNLHGWRQVFQDDFNGTALDTSKWGRYTGQPGSDPGSQWAASHVTVGGGAVSLSTYRDPAYNNAWTSGGINNAKAVALTAGKYDVRMRADRAKGINAVALLWPKSNTWPPEIDFVEDRDGDRDNYAATLHYRDAAGAHKMIHRPAKTVDMTGWHTYGVEWGPDRVVYTLDGAPWARIDSPHAPDLAMGLAIQTNAVTRGSVKPDATTPSTSRVQVDWVVGYAADPHATPVATSRTGVRCSTGVYRQLERKRSWLRTRPQSTCASTAS